MFLIKSAQVRLHGAAESMQGGRPENQDDLGYVDTPLGFLFIVCDGMGGGPGGKTASGIVKLEIAQALSECTPQTPREAALRRAVGRANEVLAERMEQSPTLHGMGSTFVAVLVNEWSVLVAHAGDSRCYRLHGRRMLFRTQDHSLVGELVRKKALTEEQARTSPQSNVISRGLGSLANHVPEIVELPYRRGDRFVLCTDGVWGMMPHRELLRRLTAAADCKQVVNSLSVEIDRLGQAQGGHHDNHTIGIIEMDAHSRMRDNQFLVRKVLLATAAAALVAIIALAIALGHVSKKDDYTAAVATGQGGGPTGVQIPYAGTPPDTADTTASPTREYATRSTAATLHNTLIGEATALLRAVKQHEDTTKLDVEQEKARRLKRAQDLLHKMSQKMREVDTVARFVKRNERAMLRVASEKGIFRSTPQARTLIDSAITQLEKLKKTAGTEPAPTDTATTGEAAAQQTQ